jgi:GNAT superfamily N-acetyltransferase
VVELVATPPDAALAAPLVAALIEELAGRYGEELTVPYDAGLFAPPDGLFVLAVEGGAALACGGFVRFDAATAELKRMYVTPAARGRGLARRLLAHLEGAARGAGYTRIVLETGDRQPEALGLYRVAGYTEMPRYPPYVDWENSVCMERPL